MNSEFTHFAKGLFMFHKDYLVRQIELMTESIACLVLNTKTSVKQEVYSETSQAESDLLHVLLCGLIEQKRINDAENLLFDSLNPNNYNHLAVAMDFYNRVNNMTDEELEDADFSREEIAEGLDEVRTILELEDM